MVQQREKSKLTEFKKFKIRDHISDRGRHRRPLAEVIVNKGVGYTEMKTTIMYSEEMSRSVSWLDEHLNVMEAAEVPIEK